MNEWTILYMLMGVVVFIMILQGMANMGKQIKKDCKEGKLK